MPRTIPDPVDELERMKTSINLTEYAAAQGYQIDRRKSSRHSVSMRHIGGDKIVIGVDAADRHWIFFTISNDRACGSIIDFVKYKQNIENFGLIRKQLRPWIGEGGSAIFRPSPMNFQREVEPSHPNRVRVAGEYAECNPLNGPHRYLQQIRCLPVSTLQAPRFAGKIRVDSRGNAIFPHHDLDGLCGFEKKNKNFTGFASGGSKGVWVSASNSKDTTLVLAESAIDGLSYFTLHKPPRARYMSLGGELGPHQPDLVRRALRRLPSAGKVIIATDHDAAGQRYAELIQQLAAAVRPDLQVIDHRPPLPGQDWNNVLQGQSPTVPSC